MKNIKEIILDPSIDEEDKYAAFKISNAAICASGTVALELSYFNVPTIVIYKLNF